VAKDIGVKNTEEFRYLLRPWVLRRTEFAGQGYPDVQLNQVWMELGPQQKDRYEELLRGVLRRLRDHGEEITHAEAAAAYVRAWQICSGLATLDDGRDVSVKLDWAADKITGDLEHQKVVVFSYFKPNVTALSARLEREGVGHVLMWSAETDARVRDERVRRFSQDPDCRVLIGTTTIEQSLNLQAAGHLICVDAISNPARMTQVIGRIRRQGSVHRTCFVHQLLIRGSIEEAILPRLALEQGLADSIWGEASDIYPASLAPRDMLRLIAGERA
jgi:SNF2 family DNA or RNA helicase